MARFSQLEASERGLQPPNARNPPVTCAISRRMNDNVCDPTTSKCVAPPLTRTLVLVGLMGAGKTTIGRRLAARLGVPFKDADAEIELAAGKSVSELFAEHGEPSPNNPANANLGGPFCTDPPVWPH